MRIYRWSVTTYSPIIKTIDKACMDIDYEKNVSTFVFRKFALNIENYLKSHGGLIHCCLG